MRSEKPADLLKLARELAASAEGMTLDEMAEFSKVGRRTIERRRDAIEAVFGPLDRIEDGRLVRFRMHGRGLGSFAVAPTSEELAELENAARVCRAARDDGRAEILRSLHRKIRASLRATERLRLAADIDAQLRAGAMVKFRYGEEGDVAPRWRKVIPYGLLFAPRFYLAARLAGKPEPVLFRLDRMRDLVLTEEPGAPPESFDLEAYASSSFGVFQEEAEDIVLRFDPSAASDARAYLFHPSQTMTEETDGSLIVRFRAAGLLQIAHHLMTWGSAVTILEPERLEDMMREQVEALHGHYRKIRRKPRAAKAAAE